MICILMLIKICSGYMSPEYAFEGLFLEKSDVFISAFCYSRLLVGGETVVFTKMRSPRAF